MDIKPEKLLRQCFDIVIESVDPGNIFAQHLPENRDGNAIVIGAGKAAASMARAFEDNWNGKITGIVVVPYDHLDECAHIKLLEASHPTPDQSSIEATETIISLVENLSSEDEVHVLLSGGGSSLLCKPPKSITLQEKRGVNLALLRSGASINEINTVRKHLSLIKGGRLAEMTNPGSTHTYVISDVVGNDPAVIASGPTIADPSTRNDAIKILERYSVECPKSVLEWLQNPASETIKDTNPKNTYKIIASAQDALTKLGEFCLESGIHFINLGELTGNASNLGKEHALIAKQISNENPTLIYSGGETTVKVKGSGKGGRNTEYLLSLAIALNGTENIYALAADTDGIDGKGDHAGAIIKPDTLDRLASMGSDAEQLLKNNDSYTAFSSLNDLIITGPTKTNINDLRAILIMPS